MTVLRHDLAREEMTHTSLNNEVPVIDVFG